MKKTLKFTARNRGKCDKQGEASGFRVMLPSPAFSLSGFVMLRVGGTEKNIAAAFDEAETNRSILFFDEIDGLLQSRERAQYSWEVSQVNELLHRMENFSGVMIGATNFLKNLDPAVRRRFTFKIAFDYLDNAGKKLFFEQMFHTVLSAPEIERLNRIANLTPGDFRTVVRQSLFYLGGQADNQRHLTALEQESAGKPVNQTHRIGF